MTGVTAALPLPQVTSVILFRVKSMTKLGYLIVDGNSLGHFYNNARPLKIGNTQVQSIYGFLRGLRGYVASYQHLTPIVVWDGASWRKTLFSSYKEIRDKVETKNEIELAEKKAIYKKQAPYIEKALRFLGIAQVRAFNMEADDLGAILADRYTAKGSKIVLLTGDKDWIQLVGPNVIWRDPIKDRSVTMANFKEFTGVDTPRQFVEVKALAGDTGDSVPGVGGIGEKGAIDFLNTYGSLAEFNNRVLLDKSLDVKKLPKKYRALAEDESKLIAFSRNINLVDLRTKERPEPINLRIDKGEASIEKFQAFCDMLLFASITQDLNEWIRVFPAFQNVESAAA